MIQDIYPSTPKNEYKAYPLREEDSVLVFSDEGKLIAGEAEGRMIKKWPRIFWPDSSAMQRKDPGFTWMKMN